MTAKEFAGRASAFVRSVLPAEPAHWMMLAGTTLLLISANISWWSGPLPNAAWSEAWRLRAASFSRLFVISAAAGYYLCFVPRKARGYFPFLVTLAPAAIAFATMLTLAASWTSGFGGHESVIQHSAGREWSASDFKILLAGFDTGFYTAAAGFVLVVIVLLLCLNGRGTLPMRLAQTMPAGIASESEELDHSRTMRFIWVMISLLFIASLLAGLFVFPLLLLPGDWLQPNRTAYAFATAAIDTVVLLVLVLFSVRPDVRSVLRDSFRLPPPRYLGLGILIPAILGAIWPAVHYLQAWMTYASGSIYAPPHLLPYFELPVAFLLWLLMPAMVEEIAWRGYLQPRFIRRYGMGRGIFFVGLVWGAFHFANDIRGRTTVVAILLEIAWRLCMTVSLSYVLAWLTIRSRSALPAGLAHGAYNIFLYLPAAGSAWTTPVLWGVCAWLLFRYFPVEPQGTAAGSGPGDAAPGDVAIPDVAIGEADA